MTSPTDKTETVRRNKASKAGRARKNKLARVGTTPTLFKLDKPVESK